MLGIYSSKPTLPVKEQEPLLDSLYHLGQLQKLEEYMGQGVEESPLLAYYNAKVLLVYGKFQQAVDQLVTSGKNTQEECKSEHSILDVRRAIALSEAYCSLGQYEEALELAKDQVKSAKRMNDPFLEGLSRYQLVRVYVEVGEFNRSKTHVQKFNECIKPYKNPYYLAKLSWINSLVDGMTLGSYGKAQKCLEQALGHFRDLGNRHEEICVLTSLADLKTYQGYLGEALGLYEQATQAFIELANDYWFSATLGKKAMVEYYLGNFDKARKLVLNVLNNPDLTKNDRMLTSLLYILGRIYADQEQLRGHMSYFEQFFGKERQKSPLVTSVRNLIIALAEKEVFNLDNARIKLRACLETETTENNIKIYCHELVTEIALVKWLVTGSKRFYTDLLNNLQRWETFSTYSNLNPDLCKVFLVKAKVAEVSLNYVEAKELLEKCQGLARENDLPLHERLAEREIRRVDDRLERMEKPASSPSADSVSMNEFKDYIQGLNRMLHGVSGEE